MKTFYLIIIAVLFLAIDSSAQNLLDIYKKGTVKLIPDENYGKGNDWNNVFESYHDHKYNKHIGKRKSIKMLPDGSVVVNHDHRHYYSLFSPEGKFVKNLEVKSKTGTVLKKVKNIAGVLDNDIFFTGLDNMGEMDCFDFEGNHLKTLTLDYKAKQIIPLPNKKLAVVGWVIWSDRFRDFVSIVDYETNEETIIWEHFTKRYTDFSRKDVKFNYGRKVKGEGSIGLNTMPFTGELGLRPVTKLSFVNNTLNICIPKTGDILKYTPSGKYISKQKVSWKNPQISVEEQKQIQQKAITGIEKDIKSEEIPGNIKNAYESILADIKSDMTKITKPIEKPYFSTVIKDSDNNLLFFEYPENEGENKFNVYTFNDDGKFVCQSTFQCDDYNLIINNARLIFKDGYLYGIQELKDTDGVPQRLVRFKLTN